MADSTGGGYLTLSEFTRIALVDMIRACQVHLKNNTLISVEHRLDLIETILSGRQGMQDG